MMVNVVNTPASSVVRRVISPEFAMNYPEVWHAERIPPAVLQTVEQSWKRQQFPSREVTVSLLEDVFVATEGLVFTSALELLQPSITGHSADQIERARVAIVSMKESGNIVHLDGTLALCKKRGARNYGHWAMEMLPKAFVVQRHWSHPVRYMVQLTLDPLREVMRQSMAQIGIGAHALIEVGDEPVLVERLLMVDGLTSHGSYMSPLVMECIETISSNISADSAMDLLILREGLRSRRFVDEDEVRSFATSRGFSLIDPANMPFVRQVACFKGARRIVGVMGAAMTNLAFSHPGTKVFNLTPAGMSDTFFWFISGLRSLQYTEVRCEQVPPTRGPMPWDTDLLLDRLDRDLIFNTVCD